MGKRIRLKSLAIICRSLSTLLQSGIALPKAFELAAAKSPDARARNVIKNIRERLNQGEDVAAALNAQGDAFPPMMRNMVDVAEQSGALPEILVGLADHYDNLIRLRRHFLSAIAWPIFQFTAAVLVIALMIVLLGWIAEFRGNEPVDVLGWGLTGTTGGVVWLTLVFGTVSAIFAVYWVLSSSMAGKQLADKVLMAVPVLSACLRSFAVARFSWSYALTQQAGMPADQSVRAALNATSNGTFLRVVPFVVQRIQNGDELAASLASTGLFPEDFLHMVNVAETSGTVPEMLARLSPQFEEQARRSLSALASALAWLIWVSVAVFIVMIIFRIITWYLNMLDSFQI